MTWQDDIISTIAFFAICLAGIVLNCFEIASLLRAKRTKLPFDLTLISLAAADLITALTLCISPIPVYIEPSIISSAWFSKINLHIIYASNLCSAFHMILIAVQRLVAVLFPLKISIWITRKRAIITFLFLWMISNAFPIPIHLGETTFQRFLNYTPLISAGAILLCYIIINYKTMTRRRISVSQNTTQNLHILLYSICVTAIFFACTLPYTIEMILKPTKMISVYAFYFFLLQFALNPIAYYLFQTLKRRNWLACCRVNPGSNASVQMQVASHASREI